MFTKTLKFNTKRGYSADGQTIEAIYIPTRIDDNGDQVGALEFVDVTRGIDGRFENVAFTNREIFDGVFQARVMDLYDRGGYESTQVIKLDFQPGGKYVVGYHAGAAEALAEFDERKPKAGVNCPGFPHVGGVPCPHCDDEPVDVPDEGHTFTGGLYSTGPTDAIDEVIIGNHVAHVRNPDNDRVVAIRPMRRDGFDPRTGKDFTINFELTFSDPKVDLRKRGNVVIAISVKDADRTIRNFLVGIRACTSVDYFQDVVNQKRRDCEIIRLTRTRARIRYWLPNSGATEAWRQCTTIGGYYYLRSC